MRSQWRGSIPGPESITERTAAEPPPSASRVTCPPLGVNLMALSRRLTRTCSRARRSAITRNSGGPSYPRMMRFSVARARTRSIADSQNGPTSTDPISARYWPDSRRERSRRSRVSRASRSAWRAIISTNPFASGAGFTAPPSNVSTAPEIAATGVRSSWLALAMKSRRTLSMRFSSVRSRRTRRPPEGATGEIEACTTTSEDGSRTSAWTGGPASAREAASDSSELRLSSSKVRPAHCSRAKSRPSAALAAAICPLPSSRAAGSGIPSTRSCGSAAGSGSGETGRPGCVGLRQNSAISILGIGHAVASAPHRLDQVPAFAQLLAKALHVRVHGARLRLAVHLPDITQEHLPRLPPARPRHQRREQLELAGGEINLSLAHVGPVRRLVDPQRPQALPRRLRLAGGTAPQHGPDPQQQLANAEGFGDEIVRAELEAHQAIHFLAPGGDHDHRQLPRPGVRLDAAAHLGTRQIGQHQVEQHQVRARTGDLDERLLARHGDDRIVSSLLQVETEQVDDVLLVFDDEHLGHGADTVDGLGDESVPGLKTLGGERPISDPICGARPGSPGHPRRQKPRPSWNRGPGPRNGRRAARRPGAAIG